MPARALMAIVCLLVAGMAGCIGDQQGDGGDVDGRDGAPGIDEAPPEAYALTSCTEHEAFFDIPASQAEPYLPDGFALVGAVGEPLPEGAAVLFLKSLTCEGPGEAQTASHLWVDILVDPPAAYEHEDALFHLIHVTGVTTSRAVAETWTAWGIPHMPLGDVEFEVRGEAPGVVDAETRATDGQQGLRLTTAVPGPHHTSGPGEARLFGVEDGRVTAIVDFAYTQIEGGFGDGLVENSELIPFDVETRGVGAYFQGLDETYRYVEPPASTEGAT